MNLSERLKALGVQPGTQHLKQAQPQKSPAHPIEHVVPGAVYPTLYGETYHAQSQHPVGSPYGKGAIAFRTPPALLAAWAQDTALQECQPQEYLFFDTETTGLASAGGTYAFLIGAGRFYGDTFRVAQFFLREPGEEAAQLAALSEFASGCRVWVSFNGRSFDGPLLRTRYTLNGLSNPLEGSLHLDLLLLARRLWRERLPSRTLLSLEARILGFTRTQEDIPSWVIPRLYLDYLTTGDARLLKSVFYHNEKDVLAMAALLNHMGDLLHKPLERPETPALDLTGIASVFEKVGDTAQAIRVYREALQREELPAESRKKARKRLSFLLKRRAAWEEAVRWWQQAAEEGEYYACEELAKYYEHRARDVATALHWTRQALLRLSTAPKAEQMTWQAPFAHRLARLERKNQTK
ncbi:MAG: hypothetical protein D6755_11745 [Anaerolineae bacterium]|nr:MAG: hypothetical protein D6755_11745 [Anaerolineae bacterium]